VSAPDEAAASPTASWEPMIDGAGPAPSAVVDPEPEHGALPVVFTADAPRGRHAGPRARHLEVVVHPDAATLAEATAARLLVRLVDLQSVRSPLHLVLTGGTVGIATLRAVAASPVREAVDWSGVHVWWGDERFVPADSPDRNERQAREALLDALPLPPANIHAMPAEGTAPDEDAAAVAYAHELARFSAQDDDVDEVSPSGGVAPLDAAVAAGSDEAPGASSATALGLAGVTSRRVATSGARPAVPEFDVLLLGMGPDGHVASLFPGHATLHDEARTVVGEPDSPKPPPSRVSVTYPAIRAAREVWLVAAGEEKAEAVAKALSGAAVDESPAAGAYGTERTLWLVDLAAASKIPTA
jgi:6-phosphogluconolactonase